MAGGPAHNPLVIHDYCAQPPRRKLAVDLVDLVEQLTGFFIQAAGVETFWTGNGASIVNFIGAVQHRYNWPMCLCFNVVCKQRAIKQCQMKALGVVDQFL